ncbi:MAG: hypothetical protein ACTHKO_01485 [Sphingopyxis terrae]
MEGATAWLGCLVQGAGHELILFASMGVLLCGLDDLQCDALGFAAGRKSRDRSGARQSISGTVASRLNCYLHRRSARGDVAHFMPWNRASGEPHLPPAQAA